MNARLVIGIDPSLSATGVVALQRDGAPGAWHLVFRRTIRPPSKGSLIERLQHVDRYVYLAVREAIIGRQEPITAAVEDPSEFRIPGKGGPSQRFRFGAGVGVAMVAAARACADLHVQLTMYGVNEWLPKVRVGRGGWRAPMKHAHVIQQAKQLIPGVAPATDDETMAAAIALQHVLKGDLPRAIAR